MTRLLLVRHGETTWNAQHRYQGQIDVALSSVGEGQAAALAQRLAEVPIHAVYASDLLRARKTAEIIARPHALPVHLDSRFREMNFGVWEGLVHDEIRRRHPAALAAWQKDPANVAPPGGETGTHVAARVQAALVQITDIHQDQTVLLVAHGGSLRVLLCLALGLDARNYWQFRLDNASLSELYFYKEGAILTLLNDTHHLTEAADDS